jgi:lipopolysaccharide export LptBFGC system permease protein LptF
MINAANNNLSSSSVVVRPDSPHALGQLRLVLVVGIASFSVFLVLACLGAAFDETMAPVTFGLLVLTFVSLVLGFILLSKADYELTA